MDFILEFIITFILQGTLDLSGDKKVPVFVRVIFIVAAIGLLSGIVILLGYLAIKESSVIMFVFLVVVSLLIAVGIIVLIEKYVSKKDGSSVLFLYRQIICYPNTYPKSPTLC